MAHEIVNPYIQGLKDVATQYVENVYCILDRIMGVTVHQYTDQNLGVNEQTHAFMVNTGKFNIRITPKLMTESVDVAIITPENSIIARIELNKTGPIDEAYGKMEKSQRDEIKTYFNMLSDIDIDQPVESVAEPEIHFTED